MKFVSSKKITDYARRLHEAQRERDALKERLKTLDAEVESLEVFLQARKPDGFEFADARGYLVQAQVVPGSRIVIDLDRVRRDYARMGKAVPTRRPSWSHLVCSYVGA